MTTASESVDRALRLISVIAEGVEMTASQVQDGVQSLNRMLHSWKLRGVDVSHVDLVSTDNLVLGDEFHDGIEILLAQSISTEYGRTFPPSLEARARAHWRAIAAAYIVPAEVKLDEAITVMPSHLVGGYLVS